jgi:hypothetical protein
MRDVRAMADIPTILSIEPPPAGGSIGISTEHGQKRAVDFSDKLKVINEAAINTGNEPANVSDDTSDTWRVGSSAFEQWVPVLLHRRNWNFATRIAPLTRVRDASFPGFVDAFAKPADCLFLQQVYRPDIAAQIAPNFTGGRTNRHIAPPGLDYKIVDDMINCTAPNGASCLYTPFPVGAQPWSVGFLAALRYKIEAIIYRALNEDMAASYQADRFAEAALQEAAARADMEEPRGAMMRSSAVEARRLRRGGGSEW